MYPSERDGRQFYLSGMRSVASEPFAFLYIPVDRQGGLESFMAFLQRLHNKELIQQVALEMKADTLATLPADSGSALADTLQSSLELLIDMFVRGGYQEVRQFVEQTLPETERETLAPAYLALLREMLARVYFADKDPNVPVDEVELFFLQDAIDAIGTLPAYGSPIYLGVSDYNHIESTGLQIAHAPGKPVVYLGCALLIAGVFLLFYVPQRRIWLWLAPQNNQTDVLLAGMSNRNPRDFDAYFEQIHLALRSGSGTPTAH
jgi:cytochrome c biogenesis protein